MIKYANIPLKLLQSNLNSSSKILLGLLIVLTRKGTITTTSSNSYLGNILNLSEPQISNKLHELEKWGIIKIGRELGRRQIGLETEKMYQAGFLTKLEGKNAK